MGSVAGAVLTNLGFCMGLLAFVVRPEKYPLRVSLGLVGLELGLLLTKPMGLTFKVSLSRLVRAGGVKIGLGDGANSLRRTKRAKKWLEQGGRIYFQCSSVSPVPVILG